MKARKSLALLSVASIALLAACGSDDDSASESTDAPTEGTWMVSDRVTTADFAKAAELP